MARCHPDRGNSTKESRKRGWAPSRRSWLRMALLVFFAGALSAAGSVAAARTPDPLAAYGPPQPPAISASASASPWTVASSWSMAPVENGVAISATATTPVQVASSMLASPQGSPAASGQGAVLSSSDLHSSSQPTPPGAFSASKSSARTASTSRRQAVDQPPGQPRFGHQLLRLRDLVLDAAQGD